MQLNTPNMHLSHNLLKQELNKYVALTEEEWLFISDKFSIRHIEKGDYFVRLNQVSHKLGFVLNGLLRTFTIDNEGNEITTHFAHEASFAVSFVSFKKQTPSFESIQAIEDTKLLEISYQKLEELFHNSEKFRILYAGIIEDAFACMLERTYILQNFSAQERYDALITQSHPDIIKKAHLGHISSYLGIKLETLSRIRKQLTKLNI